MINVHYIKFHRKIQSIRSQFFPFHGGPAPEEAAKGKGFPRGEAFKIKTAAGSYQPLAALFSIC